WQREQLRHRGCHRNHWRAMIGGSFQPSTSAMPRASHQPPPEGVPILRTLLVALLLVPSSIACGDDLPDLPPADGGSSSGTTTTESGTTESPPAGTSTTA